MENIPIKDKYILSISEASEYFRIGENKMRKIVRDNADASYLLWNGNRCYIKRKKFEEMIDNINAI